MSAWILILTVIASNSSVGLSGTAITSVTFNNRDSCAKALNDWTDAMRKNHSNVGFSAICVESKPNIIF